jgi:hypothetical protein
VQLVDTAGWIKRAAALAAHDDVGGAVAEMTKVQVGWYSWGLGPGLVVRVGNKGLVLQ